MVIPFLGVAVVLAAVRCSLGAPVPKDGKVSALVRRDPNSRRGGRDASELDAAPQDAQVTGHVVNAPSDVSASLHDIHRHLAARPDDSNHTSKLLVQQEGDEAGAQLSPRAPLDQPRLRDPPQRDESDDYDDDEDELLEHIEEEDDDEAPGDELDEPLGNASALALEDEDEGEEEVSRRMKSSNSWRFIDHGNTGCAVKCVPKKHGPSQIQCASTDAKNCQWGQYKGYANEQVIPSFVVKSKGGDKSPLATNCPGWRPLSGRDFCADIGCYGGPLYRYVVVADKSVVLLTADIELAKKKLLSWGRGASTPSRMICSFKDGVLVADPHTIGPNNFNQGGGIGAGFNKWWSGWGDINRMNAIAKADFNVMEVQAELAVKLIRGGMAMTRDGMQPLSSNTNQVWNLRKCSGTDAQTCLGHPENWVLGGPLKSGDVVAWVLQVDSRVQDCAWGKCTNQVFPPPNGHWGTPYKIIKVKGGEPVSEGTSIYIGDHVYFYGMQHAKWAEKHIISCDCNYCGGTSKHTRALSIFRIQPETYVNVFYIPGDGKLRWSAASAWATSRGARLATLKEVQMDLAAHGNVPRFQTDIWTPASDQSNMWVSVGNIDVVRRLGQPHTALGSAPGWGETSNYYAFRRWVGVVRKKVEVTYLPADGKVRWSEAKAWAKTRGGRLPSVEEVQIDIAAKGNKALFNTDMWTPVLGSANSWVSVGNHDVNGRLGREHRELGSAPGWGESNSYYGFRTYIGIVKAKGESFGSNLDFEADDVGASYRYTKPQGWTGHGGIVIVPNGNGPWGGLSSGEGQFFISIQSTGSYMEQKLTGLVAKTPYRVYFLAANRPGYSQAKLLVTIDGTAVFPSKALPSSFARYFLDFIASGTTATIRFKNDSPGGDRSVFVDGVVVRAQAKKKLKPEVKEVEEDRSSLTPSTKYHYRRRRVLHPGQIVVFHNHIHRRFIRAHSQTLDASSPVKSWKELPDAWTWERWTVVSASRRRGALAFHNAVWNRFMQMTGTRMSMTVPRNDYELPHDWNTAKFFHREIGEGKVGLWNKGSNRWVRMRGHWMDASGIADFKKIPASWTWEQYTAIEHIDILQPGDVVVLHNQVFNRYLNIAGANMGVSAPRSANLPLPSGWTWERFTVVDAGNGAIALHNKVHNRFVKFGAHSSPPCNLNSLPRGWAAERWTVINSVNGNIALRSDWYSRYLRMNHNRIDSSGVMGAENLPAGWTWEQFRVIKVGVEPLVMLQTGLGAAYNHSEAQATVTTDTDTTTPPIPEEELLRLERGEVDPGAGSTAEAGSTPGAQGAGGLETSAVTAELQ